MTVIDVACAFVFHKAKMKVTTGGFDREPCDRRTGEIKRPDSISTYVLPADPRLIVSRSSTVLRSPLSRCNEQKSTKPRSRFKPQ